MGYFFKRLLIVLLFSFPVFAVDITAIYSTSCKRVIGIPLDVNIGHIYFLNMDGKVKEIPRYNVMAVATYPLSTIPIKEVKNLLIKKKINYFIIKTKHENQIVPLVEGWPVQFSRDKISFLSQDGREVLIDRQSIWKIDLAPTPKFKKIQNKVLTRYQFIHPFKQYNCRAEFYGNPKAKQTAHIFPQEYVSDPVVIKRRFDSIMHHLAELKDYYREQKFYAVPQIYKSQTSLGYWFSLGSRYGKNQHRSNNYTPILIDELSARPFGYQHIFLTGSAPQKESIHEEAQTQIYYRLKADYFNFSFFIDPNIFLVGRTKYQWQREDFKDDDDKHVESFFLGFGLDLGAFSLLLFPSSTVFHGFKVKSTFEQEKLDFNKYGFRYQNHYMTSDILFGEEKQRWADFKLIRYNLDLNLWKTASYRYSFIYRHFKENLYHVYHSKSYTNVVYGSYRWKRKYIFKAMLGHEWFKIMDTDTNHHLKIGVNANLIF